jgi:uncharacterized protein YkwD
MSRLFVAMLALITASTTLARTPDLPAAEAMVAKLTNELRAAEGRDPVSPDPRLQAAARDFAAFMARTDKYGHTADGREPAERAKASGYDYCHVSENISYQYHSDGFRTGELATRLVEGWNRSAGHRQNMLERSVTHMAVAVAQSESTGRYYAVQLFARPRSLRIAFRVRNDSGERLRYTLGKDGFALGLHDTHTHQRCGRDLLRVEGGGKPVEPRDGEEYVVARVKGNLAISTSRASSPVPR